MNSPTKDIANYLEGISSLGLILGKNLFCNREPSTPNNIITIFDTSSIPPQLNLTDKGYEYPSIQIRVRNTDYEDGWSLINSIKDVLHGNSFSIGSTLYTVIYVHSGPALLDWDENSRARCIINFELQRRI